MFFASNLKYLRKNNQMTQEQLANELGLKDSAVRRYENGQTANPGILLIIQIAKYFNVSLDQLVLNDLAK